MDHKIWAGGPSLWTPIDSSLETLPTLKQESLLVMVKDPFFKHDAIPDKETQFIGLSNETKEAIGKTSSDLVVDFLWDVCLRSMIAGAQILQKLSISWDLLDGI